MSSRRWVALVLAFAFISSGCSRVLLQSAIPGCIGVRDETILLAQAVPTAEVLPCVDALPVGWSISLFDARTGSARIVFDSDRAGLSAADMTFTEDCEVSEATQVPADQFGIDRFEEILDITDTYSGLRYYVFDGGCVTLRFSFSGIGRSTLAEELDSAIGFLSRDELAARLKDKTGADL